MDVGSNSDIYPLSDFDGTMKTTEWSKLPSLPGPPSDGGGETKWVLPEQFFDQLGAVLDSVPALPGEEALRGQFRVLLDAVEQNRDITTALVDTAVAAERDIIAPFFQWVHNDRPTGNGWNRSTNNTPYGVDYMFDNRPTETQYFYTDDDAGGASLQGNRNYRGILDGSWQPPAVLVA